MKYSLVLTRDGAVVSQASIPPADYEAIRARTLTTIALTPRGPTLSVEIDTAGRVYRIEVVRTR